MTSTLHQAAVAAGNNSGPTPKQAALMTKLGITAKPASVSEASQIISDTLAAARAAATHAAVENEEEITEKPKAINQIQYGLCFKKAIDVLLSQHKDPAEPYNLFLTTIKDLYTLYTRGFEELSAHLAGGDSA